ncbi:MAG: YdcF family protein [Cyanobacteria bacterium J06638_6]
MLLSPLLLYLPMKAMLGLFSAADNASVDTIVVLGRGPNSLTDRAFVAAQYWQDNQDANIFVSGMMDAPVIMDTLQEMGVPATQISGERCSESTWENALFSDALLQPSVNDRILLITDEPHMLRSIWVFKGFGFKQVEPYVVEQNPIFSLSLKRAYRMIREYAALVKYGVLGRYTPATPEQHRQAEAAAKFRVEDWNCYLPATESTD